MAIDGEGAGRVAARPVSRIGADLWPRVGAAIVMALVALMATWVGGFVFTVFWWAASAIVFWEWQRLLRAEKLIERVALGAFVLATAAIFAMDGSVSGAVAALAVGAGVVGWLAGPGLRVWAGGGTAYAGSLVVSLALLRASPGYGAPAILWLFAVVWGSDIAAYFAGRLIGGPRLWPRVSPGKTWSGAIVGALAGTALGLMLAAWTNRIDRLFWLGLAAAVASQGGDLFEVCAKAAVRGQRFERPYSWPWRPDGQIGRLHCGFDLRCHIRRASYARSLHGERNIRMVTVLSSTKKAHAGRPRAGAGAPKRLAILGATGSIGGSCAQVIAEAPDAFSVVSIAGGADALALARRAIELKAEFAALADPMGYSALKEALAGRGIEVAAGPEAVREAALREADLVVSAIVGAAGLEPTFGAVAAGRTVALANKETLVCAGSVVMRAAERSGSMFLPMDSEHNALFQALGGRDPGTIATMTITASGGPFRKWTAERIAAASPEEALAHPNWIMGRKVTIDSASLMNKGLELIEAHFLFGVPPNKLDVIVHPQSIVHGLIAFADGSLIAGLASPDMRTPIAHCLGWPDRIASGVRPPDLAGLGSLTFERADLERFPALGLAIGALAKGAGAPTVLNAANEIAVEAFLNRRIGFGDIPRLVEETLSAMDAAGELAAPVTVAEALAIHHIAGERTQRLLA